MRQKTHHELSLDRPGYASEILPKLPRQHLSEDLGQKPPKIVPEPSPYRECTQRKERQMNKADIINEVAQVVSTKKEAQSAVDCVLDSITKALKKGDTVTLVGFGTFKVVKRKARKGRNPQTGEEIKISASKSPKFVAGKGLKDAVN